MNIELYGISQDYIDLFVSVLIVVLPTLLGVALTFVFGAGAVAGWRKFIVTIRPAVDEPSDPVIRAFATLLKMEPEQLAKITSAALNVAEQAKAPETVK